MSELIVQRAPADPNEYLLSGQLTYDNAQTSLQAGNALFNQSDTALSLDFSRVDRVDTAGIAVLLAWTRLSQQNQQSLTLCHLPKQAQVLIENSGLTRLLPIA